MFLPMMDRNVFKRQPNAAKKQKQTNILLFPLPTQLSTNGQ